MTDSTLPTLTVVITGDNHLGTFYSRLRPDRLQARREALQAGFRQAVNVALSESAHLFLIAGDLFDRPDPRNADRLFVAGQLSRLRDAGIPAVAICGNHDSPRSPGYDGGIVPLHEMAALGGLHLMRECDGWETLPLDVATLNGNVSVRIRGRSFDWRQEAGSCPLDGDPSLDAPRAAQEIVLLHYGVEGWQPWDNEPILSLANLNRLGADVIACGHLHKRNDARLGGALLLNPGATERMDWSEEGLTPGCAVVRLETGQPPRLEWRNFPGQPMQTLAIAADQLDLACDQGDAPDAATDWINKRIEQTLSESDAARLLLRVQISGVASESTLHRLDLDAVRRFASARCFHAEIQADDFTVRYADGELAAASGGSEIDREIETIVADLLAQAAPGDVRRAQILNGAKDALLAAYERIGGK